MNNDTKIIYSAMKECYDNDIEVFEQCQYVGDDENDVYVDIKLNKVFFNMLKERLSVDENYINTCVSNIVLNDLADMIVVDNVPKEICEAI